MSIEAHGIENRERAAANENRFSTVAGTEAAVSAFTDAMASHGIFVADPIITDGQLHRYRHREDKRGRRNVWAVLHVSDDHPAGMFGDLKRLGNAKIGWRSNKTSSLTPKERAELRERSRRDTVAREQKQRELFAVTAAKANVIWDSGAPCESHPYLSKKGVGSYGLRTCDWKKKWVDADTGEIHERVVKDALLVPLRNGKGKIKSLQAIFPNDKNALGRDKDFLAGGEKKGLWYSIGKPTEHDGKKLVCIAEGYSTAAAVHAATGFGVLVAFDCGNLGPVARKLRELMPDTTIVLCADNDQWTERNPGIAEATHAAQQVGGVLVAPQFDDTESKPTDWCDLALLAGSEEVKRQILEGISRAKRLGVIDREVAQNFTEPHFGEEPPPADESAYAGPSPDYIEDYGETLLHESEPKPKREHNPGCPPEGIPDALSEEIEEKAAVYFSILGYDNDEMFVFVREAKQAIRMRFSDIKSQMIRCAPFEWWQRQFAADGQGGQVWKDYAQNWLTRAAYRKGHYAAGKRKRGRGAWTDNGRFVYHFGDHLTVDGAPAELGQLAESKYCYCLRDAMPSIDVEPISDDEGLKLLRIAQSFRWQKEASGPLLAGWCALAPLGGALRWRPHIWISGGPGAGKTTVLGRFVKPLMNDTALFVDGGTTAAGVRGALDCDALPVLFDESETTNEKEAIKLKEILTMARGAASESGAVTLKGTSTGGYVTTIIRSMFCLSSIAVGIERQQDYERFTILALRPKKEAITGAEAAAQWDVIDKTLKDMEDDRELPKRLMRRSIDLMPTTLTNIRTFSRAAAEKFGSQREGDQYGALMAGAWSLCRATKASLEAASKMLNAYDWNDYLENAAEEESSNKALSAVLQQILRVNGTMQFTVYQLLSVAAGWRKNATGMESEEAALDCLRQYGITLLKLKNEEFLVIANRPNALLRLLKDTPYHTDLRSHLLLCKGAQSIDRTVSFHGMKSKGVWIPLNSLSRDDEPIVDRKQDVELGDSPW